MKDGLYRVETKYFVAGFVLRDGEVTHCAPILYKKFNIWLEIAEWVCE